MSKKMIFLTILGVLVAVLVVAAIVVEVKYNAILSSPRISYEGKLLKPETRGIILINVPLAKDFLDTAFLKSTPVPGWVLPMVLPYEAAIVLDTDFILSEVKLNAFINDKRLAPLILDKVNSAKIPAPFDQWLPEKMKIEDRGAMLRKGSGKMDREIVSKIREVWKDAKVDGPIKTEGGHLAELVLDNRDGGATALALTLASLKMPGMNFVDMLTEGRLGVVKTLGFVRLTADIAPDQTLKLHLTLDCSQEQNAVMVGVIGVAVENGVLQLQSMLAPQHIDLKGKSEVKGKVIEGNYTIANFNEVLKRFI